jgi:hypothetical protein
MSTIINISQQDNCKVDHIKIATLASSFNTAVACDGVSPNEVIFMADTQVGLVTGANNGNCYTITTPTLGPATITSYGGVYPDCGTCPSA